MWQVRNRLFLGDAYDAADQPLLSGMQITHVLNCAYDIPCYFPTTFTYQHLQLSDPDPQFIDRIGEICGFIDEACEEGSVLVHCRSGISRSPAAILAYLCSVGQTLDDALETLQEAVGEEEGGFIEPDELFLEQMRDYFEDADE